MPPSDKRRPNKKAALLAKRLLKMSTSEAPFPWEGLQVEPYLYGTSRPSVYTGTNRTVPDRSASRTRTGQLRK